MDKKITIDGREVGFRASALTPRLYRHKFHRDIMRDLNRVKAAYKKAVELPPDAPDEEKIDAQLDAIDLEVFEDVAYIMAKQYDAAQPSDPGEWLDQFDTLSIYEILPELLDLWTAQQATTSTPKNA